MHTMTEVRERPIPFSGEMVRAILDGRKSMTRRVVKPQPEWIEQTAPGVAPYWRHSDHTGSCPFDPADRDTWPVCPYGQPGDRLWVRETWQYADWTEDGMPWVRYEADGATRFHDSGAVPEEWADRLTDTWEALSEPANYEVDNRAADRRWRPSIHMPRWASRITLEITDVRVERAQEITEADAIAEGINPRTALAMNGMSYFPNLQAWALTDNGIPGAGEPEHGHRGVFAQLWDSLNAPRGYGWDANPWVWVVNFNRINP
jgi:hypothetical protein